MNKDRPLVIAHRGDTLSFTENSADAIHAAALAGADWVEMDLRWCADSQIVVAHDREIAGHAVDLTDLSELRRVHPSLITLSEAFEAATGLSGINIEIKHPISGEAEFFASLTEQVRAWDGELLISSFWLPYLDQAKAVVPGAMVGVLTAQGYDPDGVLALEVARSHGYGAVLPEEPAPTKNYIEEARRHSIRTVVWTVNDPVRISDLADWGIHGVITDDPRSARQVVGP